MFEEQNQLLLRNENLRNYKIIFQFWNVIFIILGLYIIFHTGILDYIYQHRTTTVTVFPDGSSTPIFDATPWWNIIYLSYSLVTIIIYFSMVLVLLTYFNIQFSNNADSIELNRNKITKIIFIAIGWNFIILFSGLIDAPVSLVITLDLLFGIILMDKLLNNNPEIRRSFVPIKNLFYILSLVLILIFIAFNIIILPVDNNYTLDSVLNKISALIYILMGLVFFVKINAKLKQHEKSLVA